MDGRSRAGRTHHRRLVQAPWATTEVTAKGFLPPRDERNLAVAFASFLCRGLDRSMHTGASRYGDKLAGKTRGRCDDIDAQKRGRRARRPPGPYPHVHVASRRSGRDRVFALSDAKTLRTPVRQAGEVTMTPLLGTRRNCGVRRVLATHPEGCFPSYIEIRAHRETTRHGCREAIDRMRADPRGVLEIGRAHV